ncbi:MULTISPECIES: aldehyde dehydrogenase family protein [Burkholderia]|uniref:aldehyde dehydrogenase family protein n=1 Tax=Burkholderia TaxID=32008 RepID=UPI00211B72B7|nr:MULTISPECIES: aldehyde dehydrogenase family protein [Burkholderia]
MVIKPSEEAPLAVSALASLIEEAGFPNGVVNIVNGGGPSVGRALVNHADVDKISFTVARRLEKPSRRMSRATSRSLRSSWAAKHLR